MKDELPFKTLIASDNCKDRWYPVDVYTLRSGFNLDEHTSGYHPLIENLSYNIQYLQFLEKAILELKTSEVIHKMLIKNYVVTGMGIVEGIFSNIMKSNGWWPKTEEGDIILKDATVDKKFEDGTLTKIHVTIREKVPQHEKGEMKLNDMIGILKSNKRYRKWGLHSESTSTLDRLKTLRNRVHLERSTSQQNDHDYNAFDDDTKKEMQSVLYQILCSDKVTKPEYISNFDFLKEDDE